MHVIDADPGLISELSVASHAVNLAIPTQAGVQYQLEYTDSLDHPVWQPLGIFIGNGSVMQMADPEPADFMRFYRVRAP